MCVPGSSQRSPKGVLTSPYGETQAGATSEIGKPAAAACKVSIAASILSGSVHAYRLLISPWIGPRCRFLPTCSDYALDALARHGAIRGGWLTLRRLARCHPFGGSGFDPVPDEDGTSQKQGSLKHMC